MTTTWVRLLAVGLLVAGGAQAVSAEDRPNRLGGGANYWKTIDDLTEEGIDGLEGIEDSGYNWYASYQYWPSLVGLELQVEGTPDWLGQGKAYAPQAYLLVGGWLYGGVGVGIEYADSEWGSDPFYAVKAGFNFEILPGVYVDISGNYRANSKAELEGIAEEIDTDAVFVGAGLRLGW